MSEDLCESESTTSSTECAVIKGRSQTLLAVRVHCEQGWNPFLYISVLQTLRVVPGQSENAARMAFHVLNRISQTWRYRATRTSMALLTVGTTVQMRSHSQGLARRQVLPGKGGPVQQSREIGAVADMAGMWGRVVDSI